MEKTRRIILKGVCCSLFILSFVLCGLQASAQPTSLIDGGLFYFPPSESLVTFGGWGPPDWTEQTAIWALSATGWSALPEAPEGITHTGAAFDAANQRMIVMGGSSPDKSTWAFDGTTWSKISDPLTSDYGVDPEMIYDPETQEVILYMASMSYMADEVLASETYVLGDSGWEKLTVDPAPGGYVDVGFVYDEARQEGLWFNGSETWTWKNRTWTQKQTTGPAFDPGQFGVAYDAARQVAVLYGAGETWTWDGSAWTKQSPAVSPPTPERGFFAFGYDAKRQVVVLYGGEIVLDPDTYETDYLNDIWEWNGTTWSEFGASTPVSSWNLF